MSATVAVSPRGAARWARGHPWMYRADVQAPPGTPPGIVQVTDRRGRFLGQALFSPASEIQLRLLTTAPEPIEPAWWQEAIAAARARRAQVARETTAYRIVHAEGDGLPSLVVDRYGDIVVAQLLSAGLEAVRPAVLEAIVQVLEPAGVLLRHDTTVRRHEQLPLEVVEAYGTVPELVEVQEHGIRCLVNPRAGQKTGAFLDQRDNRRLLGERARGRGLDVFSYQGWFALHLARGCDEVLAIESSAPALELARRNAALNGVATISWQQANAFDQLRALERRGERFDTIVLDPPAFAKRKEAVPRALAGYQEINLRALRLLSPGGVLYTASCSFHISRQRFLDLLAHAAAASGRRVVLERLTGQSSDHPELLTVPETGYLKGAVLRALD